MKDTLITENNASTDIEVKTANNIMFKLADRFNFNKVDFYTNSGIDVSNVKLYTLDGLHPNSEGMYLITKTFINALSEKYIIL